MAIQTFVVKTTSVCQKLRLLALTTPLARLVKSASVASVFPVITVRLTKIAKRTKSAPTTSVKRLPVIVKQMWIVLKGSNVPTIVVLKNNRRNPL